MYSEALTECHFCRHFNFRDKIFFEKTQNLNKIFMRNLKKFGEKNKNKPL